MATKTFEELKQMAIQIRDEKTNKQNTATRIGTQMVEHLNKLEQEYYDKTTLDKRVTELNISELFPTEGVDGSNRYTLDGAISKVSAEYRKAGLKVTFTNENEDSESYEYLGKSWTISNFVEVGAGKFFEVEAQGSELCLKLKSGGFSYLSEDGDNIAAGDGKSFISDYIPVTYLKAFKYKLGTICPTKNAALIAAFDSNKSFIKEKSIISEGNTLLKKGLYIIDQGVSFIKICYNLGLDVSCISSPKVPFIYEEDVKEANKKTLEYINISRLRGLSPYGLFLTLEDFTLNLMYDNSGNILSSSTLVSTPPIKIRTKSLFNLLYKGNSLNFDSYYNIFLAWRDNPETAGYSGDNKLYNKQISPNTDSFSINIDLDNQDSVYVSFTIPKKNLSENTVVTFGMYDNYLKEKEEYLGFLLGSLKKRINLSSEILDGYQVTNIGQITPAGGANFNTYVVKVEEGKTYYFYNKLSDNSVEAISLNWATRNKNKIDISAQTLHYGTGNNATMQVGDEYLYVGIAKSKGILMVSDSEQTRYYEPENLAYIEIQELKNKVAYLEEKENKNHLLLEGFNYLKKNNLERKNTESVYSISEASSSSHILDYTDYAALVGTNGLNSLFRFSSPACRIRTELYPNNLVIDDRIPSLGFTVEFYCTASSFEIMGFANYFAGVVIDGEYLGQKNGQLSGRNYIFINLSTTKKRLVKIYTKSNSFYGIRCNNDGEITAFYTEKFLCAFDGDSVVEGSNAGSQENIWAQIASTMIGVDCFNCAMGGTGYGKDLQSASRENMIDRFEHQIAQYNPDILVVSAGINDTDEGFETYVDNYYSQAKQLLPNCKIVICSNYFNHPIPESDNDTWNKANAKCEILKKAALKYELPFIDYLHRLTYDSLGNLITNNIGTEMNTNLITEENYSKFIDADIDITHPTPYGHNVMGKYIGNELFKILKDLNGY